MAELANLADAVDAHSDGKVLEADPFPMQINIHLTKDHTVVKAGAVFEVLNPEVRLARSLAKEQE